MKPVVLVIPGTQPAGPEFDDYSIDLSHAYLDAVLAVGALPWVMPCTTSPELAAEFVRRCDGILLTGGDDVQPRLYGRKLNPRLNQTLSPHDPTRDLAELGIIREVFRQRKPLLAICRGMQILNVSFGGTLFADLPIELPGALNHGQMHQKDGLAHPVEAEGYSLLFGAMRRKQFQVNSTHHQSVREVAKPFMVTGRSPDGVIEAMELDLAERHLLPYLLAVQFHPERLIARYPEFLGVFRTFAAACASGRKTSI